MFRRKAAFVSVILLLLAFIALPTLAQETTPEPDRSSRLILATTTSTYDSGLLDYILPDFEKQYQIKVEVVSVGSGQALELGRRGDADVLLVHDRPHEDQFMQEGQGSVRYDVMYNDFVIVGPKSDPAGIRGLNSANAFTQIRKHNSIFVSRGDDSGTNSKELAIWKQAGITPSGDWYIEAGQGMGAVLNMTAEMQGYTLSDRATYLAQVKEGLALDILVEGDPILFNPYGVIVVNPKLHPDVNVQMAQAFADWIVSVKTQALIASFKVDGQQLFTPSSDLWKAAQASEATAEPTSEVTAAP
jgi:tungstate transport system substrate-binding protein